MFLDDTLFERMMHPNVTYLHLVPYRFKYGNMLDKYINKEKLSIKYGNKQIHSKRTICNKNNNLELFNIKGKKIERNIKKLFIFDNSKSFLAT